MGKKLKERGSKRGGKNRGGRRKKLPCVKLDDICTQDRIHHHAELTKFYKQYTCAEKKIITLSNNQQPCGNVM